MKEQIYILLRERFFVSDAFLNGEHDDTPLTGKLFNFDGIRMTYLFLEIEKHFRKEFRYEKVENRARPFTHLSLRL